jgi:hypothetical protein
MLTAWLVALLVPGIEQRPPKPPAFRVTLRPLPAPSPRQVPPAVPFAVQSAVAEPVRAQRQTAAAPAAKQAPAVDATEPLPEPAVSDAPAVQQAPTADATELSTAPAASDVPPSPTDDAPLPPPGVKPGGHTLVLAAKVDHDGIVRGLKILVPSNDSIANLTYGLALQSRPLKVNPPIPEGETRWIQVQVEFVNNDSILP